MENEGRHEHKQCKIMCHFMLVTGVGVYSRMDGTSIFVDIRVVSLNEAKKVPHGLR